jgi:hypothetical protein
MSMGRGALCVLAGLLTSCAHGAAQTETAEAAAQTVTGPTALAAYVERGDDDEAIDKLVIIDERGKALTTVEHPRPKGAVTGSLPVVDPTTGELFWIADAVVSRVDWRAGTLEPLATLPTVSPDPLCGGKVDCPPRQRGEPSPAMVTRARVTEDGAHLCDRVERGDPVFTNEFDELEHEAWDVVVDLPSGQVARRECPTTRASPTPPPVTLVQEAERCGVAVGEHFAALDLTWRSERICDLSTQTPFGSGRYVPVCSNLGMTDSAETYADIYLFDLTTRSWAPVLPPGETHTLDASRGPYALMFVQHMSTAVEPAEGLPWPRSRTLDIFHTDDGLIDLRGPTPERRPLPYLDTSQLVFLR